MNSITNNSFKSKVQGIDPISGGTFIIQYAYMLWNEWAEENVYCNDNKNYYQGNIVIYSGDNPLFKIAKESPLRLQGLIASVNFAGEKRFIKIKTISSYEIHLSMGNALLDNIKLNPVTFEILDNLEYLEEIDDYRNINLL